MKLLSTFKKVLHLSDEFLSELGRIVLFLQAILVTTFKKRIRFVFLAEQIWRMTIQSLAVTAMAGFFVGSLMTIQFTMQVKEFSALGFLGGIASSAVLREVGPLLIAFMLSGKVGAFIAAELGSMSVTEQIDAIRCLGADPLEEVIIPRFYGIILSSFVLLGMGLVMAIGGGALFGTIFSGISLEEYGRHIPTFFSLGSLMGSIFKCFTFAFVIAIACTYFGYIAKGGARGVGRAVVLTSIYSMIGIVVTDWMTTVIADAVATVLREL